MDYSDSHIVFTAGVGATSVIKSWQLLEIHGEMVGGSYPNHFTDITDKSDEDTVELVKDCINGKHGENSAEAKAAIVNLKEVTKGFSYHFMLVEHAVTQTINDSNDFGDFVVKACASEAEKVGNILFLNHSTDGVLCETVWNIHTTMKYLG